jgi:hypothetical protein
VQTGNLGWSVAVVVEENPRGSRRYCWRFGLQWKPVCGERLGKRSGRERQGRLAAMLKRDEGLGFFIGRGAVCFCWRDGWSLEMVLGENPEEESRGFFKGKGGRLGFRGRKDERPGAEVFGFKGRGADRSSLGNGEKIGLLFFSKGGRRLAKKEKYFRFRFFFFFFLLAALSPLKLFFPRESLFCPFYFTVA